MHPSLTSREQDLAAAPSHQALLKNLGTGPLLKSQTHAAALRESLRRGSNDHTHSKAPSDPKGFIRRASPDMTLTPAQRQRAQREDSRQEDKQLRRMSEARAKGGVSDEDDDEEMVDGAPMSGSSLSKSMHRGAFSKLRLGLHQHMAKSQPRDYGAEDFFADLHRGAVVRPATGAVIKAIEKARTTTAKALGMKAPSVSMAKANGGLKKAQDMLKSMGFDAPAGSSLEAGYDSNSATLTGGSALRRQSLDKSHVFGTTVGGDVAAAPKLTPAMIERAASAALASGQITGAEANTIATYCAMGAACPEPLLKRLRGEC